MRRFRLFVRVVTGAHQRAGLHVAEAHGQRFLLQEQELFRRVVAGDGQVIARGTQVLADGQDVHAPGMASKSGVMVGLGETVDELLEVFRDLAARRVDILTVGQYLRPSKDHLPIARYYTPEEFRFLKQEALSMGFRHVESGPLVRSSYHAHEQATGAAISDKR